MYMGFILFDSNWHAQVDALVDTRAPLRVCLVPYFQETSTS